MSTIDVKSMYHNGTITDTQMIRLVRLGTLGNSIGITTDEFEEITGKKLSDVISLEDAKTLQHGTVNGKRETARTEQTATYDNDEFEVNRTSQTNLTALTVAAQLAIAAGKTDQKFVFRSATNTDHEFTAAQVCELATIVAAKIQEIYEESWEVKSKIDSAETVEEVFNAVTTETLSA